MYIVERVVTFDGAVHEDRQQATRHLDRLYSDQITRLAHKLNGIRYAQIAETIDGNLDSFVMLKRIQDDLTLTTDDL